MACFRLLGAVDSPVNLLPYEITYDVSDLTKDKRMNNRINLKIYAYEPILLPRTSKSSKYYGGCRQKVGTIGKIWTANLIKQKKASLLNRLNRRLKLPTKVN